MKILTRAVQVLFGISPLSHLIASQLPQPPIPSQESHELKIIPLKSLHFSPTPQGSPPEVVPPSKKLYDQNAVFLVKGLPFRTLVLLIPQNPILMRNVLGAGSRAQIKVSNFRSSPPSGNELRLNPLGYAKFYVGATRDATSQTQKPGFYLGLFTVTVAYQ